jgi:ABC-type arginine/histidine transport system permease subunit
VVPKPPAIPTYYTHCNWWGCLVAAAFFPVSFCSPPVLVCFSYPPSLFSSVVASVFFVFPVCSLSLVIVVKANWGMMITLPTSLNSLMRGRRRHHHAMQHPVPLHVILFLLYIGCQIFLLFHVETSFHSTFSSQHIPISLNKCPYHLFLNRIPLTNIHVP